MSEHAVHDMLLSDNADCCSIAEDSVVVFVNAVVHVNNVTICRRNVDLLYTDRSHLSRRTQKFFITLSNTGTTGQFYNIICL